MPTHGTQQGSELKSNRKYDLNTNFRDFFVGEFGTVG